MNRLWMLAPLLLTAAPALAQGLPATGPGAVGLSMTSTTLNEEVGLLHANVASLTTTIANLTRRVDAMDCDSPVNKWNQKNCRRNQPVVTEALDVAPNGAEGPAKGTLCGFMSVTVAGVSAAQPNGTGTSVGSTAPCNEISLGLRGGAVLCPVGYTPLLLGRNVVVTGVKTTSQCAVYNGKSNCWDTQNGTPTSTVTSTFTCIRQ